jgi:hypothetical protein
MSIPSETGITFTKVLAACAQIMTDDQLRQADAAVRELAANAEKESERKFLRTTAQAFSDYADERGRS